MEIKKIEDNFVVAQDNQFMQAIYKDWTIREIKFLNIALSTIIKEDTEFKETDIKTTDITRLLGVKKLDYSKLKSFCEELFKKSIEVKIYNEETKEYGFELFHFFSKFKYNGNGIISFKFDNEVKDYLLNLKEKFTIYKLTNVLTLKSKYSLQIYMLLKQMAKLGYRKIMIKDFCKILDIKENSTNYKNKNLKYRVLEVALKELLLKTDTAFDYTLRKTKNSKIADLITFTIYSNNGHDTFLTNAENMTSSSMLLMYKDYLECLEFSKDDSYLVDNY